MSLRFAVKSLLALVVVVCAAIAAALAFGGPKSPPAMASINEPFKSVDFSDLPPLRHFNAKDGASLAYRQYGPATAAASGSVILIHGSSASSQSMHVLAKAFAQAGVVAYALDVRGHGASGTKGTIGYVGQLEDDLVAFAKTVTLPQPSTLAGFSSGGGFVLRFAGSARQDMFQNYLLLSPFLSTKAPSFRPNSGGWVNVGVPRVVALSLLNTIGIRAFNDLPVTRFALSQRAKTFLTPEYSYTLAANFQPHRDYQSDIRSANHPCVIVAGASDETFITDKLEGIVRAQGKNWPVILLPGIAHVPLTLDSTAVAAAVAAVKGMGTGGV